ncbi:PASTA domain-containing protein [Streptomyces sp. NPDC047079]|uniref:PASTA domain-containing protein n=1 Tax=Streptomyces sp. NPDC047079 TaxID=3154607 RepID=UPI0033DDE495
MKATKLIRCLFPAATVLAATTLLNACAPGTGSDGSNPAAQPTTTAAATASPTTLDDVLKDIQASNSAAREDLQKKVEDLQKKVDEASKSAEAAAETNDVPSVVGMNHAAAMRLLHSKGFMVNEEDANGDRWIIDNSNWKVCRQDPGPGSHPATLRVAIYSVKLDEPC